MAGPQEESVRATLACRSAGVIMGASREAQHTFAGLFNGARREGWFTPGGLFVGKAECEWDWPKAWEELKALDLIEYRTEDRPNHPSHGGSTTYLLWDVTPRGREVRNDDLKWFEELMAAMAADRNEKTACPGLGQAAG